VPVVVFGNLTSKARNHSNRKTGLEPNLGNFLESAQQLMHQRKNVNCFDPQSTDPRLLKHG
jgi:hypothetical protein